MKTKMDQASEILKLAMEFGKARLHWLKVYDEVETVRGLDEFDPKHCAWENKLFRADQRKEKARDKLLMASEKYARDK